MIYLAILNFLLQIAENYSTSRPDFEPSKQQNHRYNGGESSNGGPAADSNSASAADRRSLPYPHSMPTSPTMFERGNESRLVSLKSSLPNVNKSVPYRLLPCNQNYPKLKCPL